MWTQLRLLGTTVLLSFTAPALIDAAELIANGGFETPSIGTTPFVTFPPGTPTSWTIVSGTVDLVSPSFGVTPFEGQQMLDMDGTSPGVIERSFATVSGTQYLLSFVYANNPFVSGGATVPAQVEVIVLSSGTVLGQTLTHSTTTQNDPDWTPFSQTFVANGLVSTLRFTSLSPSSSRGGIFLDIVSVSFQTPRSSSLELFPSLINSMQPPEISTLKTL
jgi:choice-of-anchor C domain-containing protein